MDAGLIRKGELGLLSVQQYLDAARSACDSKEADLSPFACVDMSFIAGLLHHGYRLAPDAVLGVYKEIEGRQVSWAPGPWGPPSTFSTCDSDSDMWTSVIGRSREGSDFRVTASGCQVGVFLVYS